MTNSAEAQALADRLRELKERSGLSYGALAKRLHVSTSTLHRYCSGDAVPVEFAPVDRLGRQCGASPDELVDLHRRWILADAQRARTDPAPDPVPPAEPVLPALAVPEPALLEPASSGLSEPAPAEPGTAESLPEAPVSPQSSPRRRRRALLVAAVAVAAVALVLGPLTPGTSYDTDMEDTIAPFTTTVRSHVWQSGCDHGYLVDAAPAAVPAPPVEQDAAAWATQQKAVDANRTIVEVTLTGQAEPAVLQALQVRVENRREPLKWNVYAMSPGCGGR